MSSSASDQAREKYHHEITRLKDVIWQLLIQVYGGRPLNSLADTDVPEAIDALVSTLLASEDAGQQREPEIMRAPTSLGPAVEPLTHASITEGRTWCPSDARVRCVNCNWLSESNGYTFCGNDDGPIGHVNFGCGDDVLREIQNAWCSGFKPNDWLGKQGELFASEAK